MQSSHPVFDRRVVLVLCIVILGACASLAKTFNLGADLVQNAESALGGDAVLHALVAIVLGYAAYWATPKAYFYLPFYNLSPLLVFILCLVMIDEFSQAFLPQRQFSWLDMALNVAGLLVGAFLYRCWFKIRQEVV